MPEHAGGRSRRSKGGAAGNDGGAAAGPPESQNPDAAGPSAGHDAAHSANPAPDLGAGSAAELTGPELARAMLEAAKRRRPASRRRKPSDAGAGEPGRRKRGYTGPGPDPRDPQPFGSVLAKLVKSRGWQRPAAEATIFGQWESVVGADVADHCRPIKLERGELTVEAESTAWATQLRLLAASLLRQIATQVGHNVVTRLRIHGPAAPSWSRGPRRVRGRGPRDTYG